jgi:uncharacterized integral membrane protein
MSRWKLIAGAIIGILTVIVVAQNTQAVETRLLFISLTMPRAVLLFITMAIGFVIGLLTAEKIVRKPPAKTAEAESP